jgi:arylsulfatase A
MLKILTLAVAATGLLFQSTLSAELPGAAQPNVVFILADDLGWGDLGCYGSTFYETPHLDRLARQGMRFTDAYAACNCCSPTRASILTGKYPARLRVTDWIPGGSYPWAKLRPPDWTQHLPLEEVTLAEALQAAGYATAAVGKWHLGGTDYLPETQGFEVNFAGESRGLPPSYFWPYGIPSIKTGQPGEYLTDRLTDEALKFMRNNRARPFFLYLAHYAVHTPIQGKPELMEKYKAKVRPGQKQKNPAYAAMIDSLDQSVGRVLDQLDALGLAKQTIVIFTSDNGGFLAATSNAPLRLGKGSPYEGGHRVPLIVRWPDAAPPASVCREPVVSVDYYPTILGMTGARGDEKHNAGVDGVDLAPLLKQTGIAARDAIYWHYPHYNVMWRNPYGAVRQGDFKLIEFDEDQRVELYNLREDASESADLAGQKPELVATLRGKLAAWRKSVGAQMAPPNSDYDPARADQPHNQGARSR